MLKVLISFLFIPLLTHATVDLNALQIFEKCQDQNCQTLREGFKAKEHQLKDQSLGEMKISKIAVKKNQTDKTYFLELELESPHKISDPSKKIIVYRHQVLSSTVTNSKEPNKLKAKVEFDKTVSLKKINQHCLKLSKKCQWKSELDRF